MFRPFRFSLEKILEFRKQTEDQARLAFSQARMAELEQRLTLERLQSNLTECLDKMARPGQMQALELNLWSEWRQHLETSVHEAAVELSRRELAAETCRRELVTRASERKLLEKLRGRQADKHARKEQQKEQDEFDEAATLRFGRTPS